MTDRIRAIIVDDEPLARKLLRSMLDVHDDVQIVGEYADGAEALTAIRQLDLDLVFLDVQMPRLTGLEVIQDLGADRDVEVVFVTAYDQYALHAFRVNAVDYLLKPFDDERLSETLERVRARMQSADSVEYRQRLASLIQQLGSRPDYVERIAVKRGERIYLQPVADVELFESEGKYVRIVSGEQVHVIRETMLQLEEILDPRTFIRISRSAIVNVRFIREIHPWFRGNYAVILGSGRTVNTTKSYRDALKRLIERPGQGSA